MRAVTLLYYGEEKSMLAQDIECGIECDVSRVVGNTRGLLHATLTAPGVEETTAAALKRRCAEHPALRPRLIAEGKWDSYVRKTALREARRRRGRREMVLPADDLLAAPTCLEERPLVKMVARHLPAILDAVCTKNLKPEVVFALEVVIHRVQPKEVAKRWGLSPDAADSYFSRGTKLFSGAVIWAVRERLGHAAAQELIEQLRSCPLVRRLRSRFFG
jgi:hypothetical protein